MRDQWRKGAKYWDKAWNPVIGCRAVSEGCKFCYAARMAEKFPELQDASGGFSPHSAKQKIPPRSGVVFVGNMTDLFGEWNNYGEIVRWIGSLEHYNAVNLILTKRANRMSELLKSIQCYESIFPIGQSFIGRYWWGMTAENQERLIERVIPFSSGTCDFGMHRWLSAEPLLGPLNLESIAQIENENNEGYGCEIIHAFDWVVVGAESLGSLPGRECKIEWIERIVEQCRGANIPVFVKQIHLNGKLVKDITKFPEHLQIREVPWNQNANNQAR